METEPLKRAEDAVHNAISELDAAHTAHGEDPLLAMILFKIASDLKRLISAYHRGGGEQ